MKYIEFNLNNYVKVKLNDEGRKALSRMHSEDDEGYTKFQMWEFMYLFGEHSYNGARPKHEMNVLIEVK